MKSDKSKNKQYGGTCRGAVRIVTTLGVLAMLNGLVACSRTEGASDSTPPPEPTTVHVAHLSRAPITRVITLPAQVMADKQVTLYAKVSGYLQSIAVDKGDKVAEGAMLARIEIPELVASRAKQQAELKAAQAEYDRLKESLQKAPDLVVPQMVDQAQGRFDVARANLQQSETLLKYATITAPFSGVITQRFVDTGALIQAGNASSAIVSLMDFHKVRLQVAVPELEASRVAVGQPVTVITENLPGQHFEGQVARFTYALDTATRTMLAEVSLDNPQLALRPGMLVTANFGIERKEQALVMPVDALVMEKTNAFAYTISDNKASKRPIKVGFNDGKNVELVEGLNPGDEVILAGNLKLGDGQPVRLAATDSPAKP